MGNKSFGLETLIYPMKTEDFIQKYWIENKPIVIHSGLERFKDFPYLFDLVQLERLEKDFFGRVSMIHPDGNALDVQTGKDAIPFLKKGYTVYFRHIQKYFKEIQGVLNKLASDLSMPSNNFTSEIFTSSGVSGVQFHSDYDLNISLLLSGGPKTWTYSKNDCVLNQTGILMPAGKKQIEPKQLEYLTNTFLPENMPDDSVSNVLMPGDLIFMPRGWWHTTHSIGDCVSVNFVMKGPHWAALFSKSLEEIIVSKPEWREYPYWAGAKDSRKDFAISELSELIDGLKQSFLSKNSKELATEIINKYLLQE